MGQDVGVGEGLNKLHCVQISKNTYCTLELKVILLNNVTVTNVLFLSFQQFPTL